MKGTSYAARAPQFVLGWPSGFPLFMSEYRGAELGDRKLTLHL